MKALSRVLNIAGFLVVLHATILHIPFVMSRTWTWGEHGRALWPHVLIACILFGAALELSRVVERREQEEERVQREAAAARSETTSTTETTQRTVTTEQSKEE
ncbi:MAG: hypothetical protein R6U93_04700 [Dehalococcoidia bacterium]